MLLALLPALALAQAPTITIRAGTVLDGRGGTLRNTTIVIAGSRITRLDPALTAATYDLSRLTVMPGGIDTHVHLTSHFDANGRAHNDPGGAEPLDQTVLYTEENAYRALMAGITTVQSIGSTLDRDLRDAIARGTIPGPRVITSLDWITPEDGDADGLRRTVRQRVAAGADVIKILGSKSIREGGGPTLSEDELRAACGEAKAHGRRCVVHAHAAEAAPGRSSIRTCTSCSRTTSTTRRVFSASRTTPRRDSRTCTGRSPSFSRCSSRRCGGPGSASCSAPTPSRVPSGRTGKSSSIGCRSAGSRRWRRSCPRRRSRPSRSRWRTRSAP